MRVCELITLYDNKLRYVHQARYLGVTLRSGKCFGVDLRSAKSNFYSSSNSIFHSAASYQNELVVLHLVSAYCKPYLLCACSECIDLNVTQIRSIEHTWQTVISHIFYIKGADVRNVCNYVTDVPLNCILLNRRMRFIFGLYYVNNSSLQFLFNVTAKQEVI